MYDARMNVVKIRKMSHPTYYFVLISSALLLFMCSLIKVIEGDEWVGPNVH